jgi:hypothetical protein
MYMQIKTFGVHSLFVVCLALLGFAACTIATANGPAGSGASAEGGAAQSDAGTGVGVGSASCSQTVTCIASCAANDEACANACYAEASPKGQELVAALATCIDSKACADSACVTSRCSAELDACVADVSVERDAGVPPTTGAPLPADLVGSWSNVNSQYGQTFTFNAGGSYDAVLVYESSGRCVIQSKFVAYVEGAASADATTLTLTPSKGNVDTTDCSGIVTRKPSMPQNRLFTWSVSAGVLTLNEAGRTPTNYKRN